MEIVNIIIKINYITKNNHEKILKFIKFQFLRGFNIVKGFWDTIFVLTDDDMFTPLGRYLINMLLFVMFILMGTVLVIFMPIILCMFKYDEGVGF